MNKVIRLGMLFNEGDVPDFGSIVEDIHQRGLYYLLAKDIPKLNTMVTRAAAENYLIGNETFDFFSGYMAYVIDHKEAGTGEIYAYHRGKDRWYEFNIRLDKSFNEIMWERHKKILRETKTISGLPPLTFKAKKAGTLNNYRIYGNTETKTRSYSGSAPHSFPIVDGAVSNYRVYGNTVNGESVGELVTDSQSGHYGKYAIPVTNNSETANIYLDEPLRKVGDEAEYVDYATQKWHRVRKNLCPYESTNNTIIGHVKQGKTYTFSFYALYECGFNLQKRNADSGQTSILITRSNCNGNVEVTFQADENFDLYFNGYSQTTGKIATDS